MNESSIVGGQSRSAVVAIGLWFAVALVVAATGLLATAPIPPPAVAIALTAVVLLLLWRSSQVREHARSLGTSTLVGFHLVRMVAGGYFLFLYQRGTLAGEFAVPAGYGDILVAAGALLVLWLCVPVNTDRRRYALLLWNALGLLDILMVLGNGIRLFRTDPGLAEQFTRFPLALLPTFVVPVVIVSHIQLFAWYSRGPGRPAPLNLDR